MNIGTEQVFIVSTAELDQQNQHTPTPFQRAFAMPVAVTAMQPEEAQTSMCLPQSMGPPSRTQMCRLCATVTELVVPIFEGEGLQNNLADKIHQHLPIQVAENDALPVVMCFQCTSTLLAWHELAVCCVEADSVMRERFSLTTQHQQQRQSNEKTNQNQIKDEKWSGREPRACVRCEHCAGLYPDTLLRAHLVAAHAPLLFLCAECNLYRNRGDMVTHMATHIERARGAKIPEESILPAEAPRTIIPVVRIQQLLPKLSAPPPLVATSSGTSRLVSISSANDPLNLPSMGATQTATGGPPPLQKIKSKPPVKQTVLNSTTERKAAGSESIEPAKEMKPRADNVREHSKEPENMASPERSNDFSDHSDTENDFGKLPESVFDAIEDSQDARSNEEQDLPETEQTKTKKPNLPRPCPVCEKQCNSVSGWYYHINRAHGGYKKVACDACDKVFATKSDLATHARTHTKEKPFACRSCSLAFSSRAGRYQHERALRPRVQRARRPAAARARAQPRLPRVRPLRRLLQTETVPESAHGEHSLDQKEED